MVPPFALAIISHEFRLNRRQSLHNSPGHGKKTHEIHRKIGQLCLYEFKPSSLRWISPLAANQLLLELLSNRAPNVLHIILQVVNYIVQVLIKQFYDENKFEKEADYMSLFFIIEDLYSALYILL